MIVMPGRRLKQPTTVEQPYSPAVLYVSVSKNNRTPFGGTIRAIVWLQQARQLHGATWTGIREQKKGGGSVFTVVFSSLFCVCTASLMSRTLLRRLLTVLPRDSLALRVSS